jgi:hypothetical protein
MCRYGRGIDFGSSVAYGWFAAAGTSYPNAYSRPTFRLEAFVLGVRREEGRFTMTVNIRRRLGVLIAVIAMSVTAAVPVALAHDTSLKIQVTKAPIAGDGTTAGAVPDFVLTFANTDPSVNGVGILEGGKIVIVLPDDFVSTSGVGNSATLLQGWQASPRFLSYPPTTPNPFIWDTTVAGNEITLTMRANYESDTTEENPGPKQVHLLLNGFENPKAGSYKVGMTITPDSLAPEHTLSGTAKVKITKSTRPSVNIVSTHSGNGGPPPFKNVQYQTVAGESLPDPVGLYLWAQGGAAFDGVELVMKNAKLYHLVKGTKMVGHVHIRPPKGASGYELTAEPSVLVEAALPPHAVQDAGLLITQFTPDSATPGMYTLIFKMKNGNTQKQYVEVTP